MMDRSLLLRWELAWRGENGGVGDSVETCASGAEGCSRAPACPHTAWVARASQPASGHFAPSAWLSLSSSVKIAGFTHAKALVCVFSCECAHIHTVQFLFFGLSWVFTVKQWTSLCYMMQYNISAHGQGSNCKGLLISHFQGFSALTSTVRWAIDQGSWPPMGPSRASRPPVVSPFTPLTIINRPAP